MVRMPSLRGEHKVRGHDRAELVLWRMIVQSLYLMSYVVLLSGMTTSYKGKKMLD